MNESFEIPLLLSDNNSHHYKLSNLEMSINKEEKSISSDYEEAF